MTDLVVAFTVPSGADMGVLRATASWSWLDAGRNGVIGTVGPRRVFAAFLAINLMYHVPRSLGMIDEILHVLPKEIAPDPDGSVGDDSNVAKQDLLECSYVA